MKALVVGAGISGLAASIALSHQGVEVELAERRPDVEALGSGITLIGPALRALSMLGVVDQCVTQGYGMTTFETLDIHGKLASRFELPSPVGVEQPGMVGMMRPALHRVLLDQALQNGTTIRTRTEPTRIDNRPGAPTEVTFNDGSQAPYDLVAGADGVHSTVRDLIFGRMPLTFRGQATVRVVLPRPQEVTGEVQYHPVGDVFVGFTPTSSDSMYMYCSFPVTPDDWPTQAEIVELVRRKTEPFGGLVNRVRDLITDPGQVNLAKFKTILMPNPWARGRTVIIGDAAHCPTPQLAAGAAMCLEDAVALAEEIGAATSVEAALANFCERRYERCRFVVDTACQLSHWQTYPGTLGTEHERVTAEAFALLAQPF